VLKSVSCIGSIYTNPNGSRIDHPLFRRTALPVTVRFSEPPGGKLTMAVKTALPEHGDIELFTHSQNNFPAVSFGTESYRAEAPLPLRFYPVAGEQHLDPEKALGCPPNFHVAELDARLAKGPVEFRIEAEGRDDLQLALLSVETISVGSERF
jgi:hypothetical protein